MAQNSGATQQYPQYPGQQNVLNPYAMGNYPPFSGQRTGMDQFPQMSDFYGNNINNPNGYPGVMPGVGPMGAMGAMPGMGMAMGVGMGFQGTNSANAGVMGNQANHMYRAMGPNNHGRGAPMGMGYNSGMPHNQAAFNGMHMIPTGVNNGVNGDMSGLNALQPYGSQQYAQNQPQMGYFTNQQKTVFSDPFPNEEESAYIRKPVNPHRHARPKRIRPSDFKALGGEV